MQNILKNLAKAILNKYQPEIIAVAGSVGKSSSREAVFTVLKNKFYAVQSPKNYNNEIGLPLSIIGVMSPGKSKLGWFAVIFKAIYLILGNVRYPKILILEMAADKPGDLDYLASIVKYKIAILTSISEVHLENFQSLEQIIEEKSAILANLPGNGIAVLNIDDKNVFEASKQLPAKIKKITFGFDNSADISVQNYEFFLREKQFGIEFKIMRGKETAKVTLPGIIGKANVYAALAGIAVGSLYKIKLKDIAESLKDYRPPKGRMNLIPGIKNTLIIDDTYNSSPQAAVAALDALASLPNRGIKYAVLGDMLELGSYTEQGHRWVGKIAAQNKINKLIVVGERSRDIARGAEEDGMSKDNIFHFENCEDAGKFIQERMETGDAVLIKGSQGMRMEKIVLEIMEDPLSAKDLLVRQEKEWSNK